MDRSATEQGSTCCKGARNGQAKVLAKVEKLMALANAKGATPNEAETALRQAAILKRQFDLSEAEISAHTVETACVPLEPGALLPHGCMNWPGSAPVPSAATTWRHTRCQRLDVQVHGPRDRP
nr:DUF2786 domain-containing protein [Pseudomonas aeruginosa]